MRRPALKSLPCPIARSLELFGDWWSLMILRDAFLGTTRFEDFRRRLGLSKALLTVRLNKLVTDGIFEKGPVSPGARRLAYRLTEKGKDLVTVMVALRQWGDRWMFPEGPPHKLVGREDGTDVLPIEIRSAAGRVLRFGDMRMRRLA